MSSGIKMEVKTRCCKCGDKVNIRWASDKGLADSIRKLSKAGKYVCGSCEDKKMSKMEVRTPESVVKRQHLTVNQAMVILDIYRGNFDPRIHTGTCAKDIHTLIENGFVWWGYDSKEPVVLDKGKERVKEMLK